VTIKVVLTLGLLFIYSLHVQSFKGSVHFCTEPLKPLVLHMPV